MAESFIVASSKPWHRESFESVRRDSDDDWHYVSSPQELLLALVACRPAYVFFLHWNWIVPAEVYSVHECVCFHMTDVPFGRGGSPLQNLILAGLGETQLSALRMTAEVDAGPVYDKRPLSLAGRAEDIYRRAGELSWHMIREIIASRPVPVPQHGEVSRFRRRTPAESVLPAVGDLARLYDHIRMLDAPTYPPAFVEHGDFRIEFSWAELDTEEVRARVTIRKRETSKD